MNNTVGNNLRILRRRKGLTQVEVSDRLHVSQSAYARKENGQTSSWGAHIQRLCTVFGVSPMELFIKDKETKRANQLETNGLCELSLFLANKLIEKYEERLKEKDEIIRLLKNGKQP